MVAPYPKPRIPHNLAATMYLASSVYATSATYFNLPVITAWNTLLTWAINHPHPGNTKHNGPVVFATHLTGQTPLEQGTIDRTVVQDRNRAQRQYLILDFDFEPGEEPLADQTRTQLITLAASHHTPLLIYPTASFPDKPRYRAVMFTQTPLKATAYSKAIAWWKTHVDPTRIDEGDIRVNTGRTIPWFSNPTQIDHIYTTLTEPGLTPLSSQLWRDTPNPITRIRDRGPHRFTHDTHHGIYRPSILLDAITHLSTSDPHALQSYGRMWFYLRALALATVYKQLSVRDAFTISDHMAQIGAQNDPVLTKRWTNGNRQLILKHRSDIQRMTPYDRQTIYPLFHYRAFRTAWQPVAPYQTITP